jgi:hypothetical protein
MCPCLSKLSGLSFNLLDVGILWLIASVSSVYQFFWKYPEIKKIINKFDKCLKGKYLSSGMESVRDHFGHKLERNRFGPSESEL